MKKFFKIIIIILFALTICSCKQKEQYHIKEIDAKELIENVNNDKEFIVALLKENSDKSDDLLKSLEKAANNMRQTLYYTYIEHIDSESSILLYSMIEKYYSYNEIVVFHKDGLEGYSYTSYQKMYDSIKKYKFDSQLERTDEETIKKTVESAHDFYKKGKIGSAYNKLSEVYSSKEAKQEENDNNLYNIIKSWDTYTSGSKKDTYVYHNLIFGYFDNIINIYEKEGTMENIEIPQTITDEYTVYYYYIKDGIIYTSKKENGKYTKRYKINQLNDKVLNITDLNNNLELNLLRRD